jgi:hypothetical protein
MAECPNCAKQKRNADMICGAYEYARAQRNLLRDGLESLARQWEKSGEPHALVLRQLLAKLATESPREE